MFSKIKNNNKGFTIVELLIVIVVIAILAAISIVAYNGIQARSRTSAAAQAAAQVVKKAEIYNADDTTGTGYPVAGSTLTGAASTTTYAVTGVTFGTPAAAATPSTLLYQKCGHTGTTTAVSTAASITVTTGARVGYWDYQQNSIQYLNAGQTSGSVGTFPVGCVTNN